MTDHSILDRKKTSDPTLDIGLAHDGQFYFTALILVGTSRIFGVREFRTEEEARESFKERDVSK